MLIDYFHYIGDPVDIYFLLYLLQGDCDFDSCYFLLYGVRVGDRVVIDGMNDGIAVVADEFIDELRFSCQKQLRFIRTVYDCYQEQPEK